MGWFSKKRTPYRDLVITVINKAMSIDLLDTPSFAGASRNNLEAVAAIFWMVERSLGGLGQLHREQAAGHAMAALLEWLSESYSPDEIRQLVIPLFTKRLDEYSEDFVMRRGEQATAPMMRTFRHIVANVFIDDDPHIAQIVAAQLLWWKPISEEGARVCALDERGDVDWATS